MTRTLQLGCGIRPILGAVNHDRTQHAAHVDVAHDLNLLPWPWADGAFDKVIALDVMEHLTIDVQAWLDEAHRVLADDGTFVMRVPAYDNPVSWRDPTHQRVFHPETFDYWDASKPLHRDYGHFYFAESARWWTVETVERVNGGDLGFVLRKVVTA